MFCPGFSRSRWRALLSNPGLFVQTLATLNKLEFLDLKFIRYSLIMKKLPFRPLPNSLNESVSAPVLLSQVRRAFEKIPDPRRYDQQFSLPDVLMSGLAVFDLDAMGSGGEIPPSPVF